MTTTTVSNSSTSTNPDIPVATDQVAGEVFQKVKLALGNNGENAGTVSSSNPLPVGPAVGVQFDVSTGELIECLQALRISLDALLRTAGMAMPDTSGRMRVAVDSITGSLTLTTVSAVTGLGSAAYNNNDVLSALMKMSVGDLRTFISVS